MLSSSLGTHDANDIARSSTSATNLDNPIAIVSAISPTISQSPSPLQSSSPAPRASASHQPHVSNISTQYDRERSTLRLGDLEPWMDEHYAHQVAALMEWPAVDVRITALPPALPANTSKSGEGSSSPTGSSQPPPRPNNPGHLFLTFASAADAASVLAQLHMSNASQSRAGRSPVQLPNSERIMELNYASRADSLECWAFHRGQSAEVTAGASSIDSPGAGASITDSGSTIRPVSSSTPSNTPGHAVNSKPGGAVTSLTQAMADPSVPPNSSLTPSAQATSSGAASVSSPTQTQGTRAAASAGEYSIFVGDLAPDVTHADIVAVFRDPTKGLRPDRGPPRKIKPFLSCKMAKIMVDQTTGLSRGYGFVRFTDEADQRRALIEMQGLYCLSRPMRLSHATAKVKGAAGAGELTSATPTDIESPTPPTSSSSVSAISGTTSTAKRTAGIDGLHSPGASSSPIRIANSHETGNNPLSISPSQSIGRATGLRVQTIHDVPPEMILRIATLARNGNLGEYLVEQGYEMLAEALPADLLTKLTLSNADAGVKPRASQPNTGSRPRSSLDLKDGHRSSVIVDDSLLDDGSRELLSSLTETTAGSEADPYNTTVFVGGLSALIPEETLRSFFSPFGEIHYVKIPPGKGCGFVQFVHKADASRAMEKMQGYAIGGSKIRLSWGRSQYRAAVAAAQATQLGINMGELQSLTEAHGGTSIGSSAQRTPSPQVAATAASPAALKQPEAGRNTITSPGAGLSGSAAIRQSEGASNARSLSPLIPQPRRPISALEAEQEAGRQFLDHPRPMLAQQQPFAPYPNATAPSLQSPGSYGTSGRTISPTVSSRLGSAQAQAAGGAGNALFDTAYSSAMLENALLQRRSDFSPYEQYQQLQQQQQQQQQASQSLPQRYDPYGDYMSPSALQAASYGGAASFPSSGSQGLNFGASPNSFGIGQDQGGMSYNMYDEAPNANDFTVRSRSIYDTVNTSGNMTRIPSYRRDYRPPSDWNGAPGRD